MRMNKKGQVGVIGALFPAVIMFAVLILASTLITGVVQSVRDTQTANTSALNVSNNGLTGLQNLSAQYGNMGQILAVVAIISLLLGAFSVFGFGRRQ